MRPSSHPLRYNLLLKIGYFPPESITFPPPEGHPINTTLCISHNINPIVISLLQHIPFIISAPNRPLFPHSNGLNYLADETIKASRDPELSGEEHRAEYIFPPDVVLSAREDRNGDDVILDTRENTIRISNWYLSPLPPWILSKSDWKYEIPDDEGHYRNKHAENAPSFLRRENEKLRNLEMIPQTVQGGFIFPGDNLHYTMKSLLIEEYGWPDNFKREKWMRDHTRLWEQLQEEEQLHENERFRKEQ